MLSKCEIASDLKAAFKINSEQTDVAKPLDWMYNDTPQVWDINGERVEYDFTMDCPISLSKRGYVSLSGALPF